MALAAMWRSVAEGVAIQDTDMRESAAFTRVSLQLSLSRENRSFRKQLYHEMTANQGLAP
jgi:hypothetical protein